MGFGWDTCWEFLTGSAVESYIITGVVIFFILFALLFVIKRPSYLLLRKHGMVQVITGVASCQSLLCCCCVGSLPPCPFPWMKSSMDGCSVDSDHA